MQSIPFGSSVEYTKQLNADRNSSPHGPCAMPPRHGQSQLISPVSGLNALSWSASSSSSPGDESRDCDAAGAALASVADAAAGVDAGDSVSATLWAMVDCCCVDSDSDSDPDSRAEDNSARRFFAAATDSIVGRELSSCSWGKDDWSVTTLGFSPYLLIIISLSFGTSACAVSIPVFLKKKKKKKKARGSTYKTAHLQTQDSCYSSKLHQPRDPIVSLSFSSCATSLPAQSCSRIVALALVGTAVWRLHCDEAASGARV